MSSVAEDLEEATTSAAASATGCVLEAMRYMSNAKCMSSSILFIVFYTIYISRQKQRKLRPGFIFCPPPGYVVEGQVLKTFTFLAILLGISSAMTIGLDVAVASAAELAGGFGSMAGGMS